ncbi:MAG TPA: hypothetical protein VFQ77_01690 [Pseudonocardiaceae bacterium]|nr:hypothetical protein [Pseudonocardiaceae bacterium]
MSTVLWLSGQPVEEQRVPASRRRRMIAARCRVTGEPKSLVAPLVGRDGSHGLDNCTAEQRRFRAELALFLLNPAAEVWSVLTHPVAAQQVWSAWTAVDRFLPYPETLVITTNFPDVLRRALIGSADNPTAGLPGLRCDPAAPVFVHLPTGATLRVHSPAASSLTAQPSLWGRAATGQTFHPLTLHERRILKYLPSMTSDAERLLAALLIRLPLIDEHCRTQPISRFRDAGSQFLWGRGRSWRFRWDGPAAAYEIADVLTDPLLGLADTMAVLRPGSPPVVRHGSAELIL